uniref:Double-strand break repair protein n=1 Tax=Mycena chlorophos TaxID=658473 RepID=A0ABQ0LP83_MYCCL|nr:predicted protein [Mycena chlorophos]
MSDDNPMPPPGPTIRNRDEYPDDTIKIMLATDNHIGYMERDPIRGQDSINTFKEILQLAVKHDVDFILLAGDLFHENKPSRDCLYKTIALLREYTLGDKPVQVELLSDPDEGKAEGFSFPAINYEDPNFNVSIPVFSIHGNHDDPQGAGADGALCALDVISVTGLINYMGKIDLPVDASESSSTGIAVRPVLLRKGNTYLGLYGMGNVKDQRMHFELRSNRVRMYMPREKNKWFNIMLLHQNRYAYLKRKVNELIDKAKEQWEERNERAVQDGEEPLEPMLPLIRLKVDTTDVKDMSNPVRFGQEFMGRLANPRDVLVFHRSKKAATRSGKVVTDEPELEDPAEAGLSTSEKLARVRVSNLVKQYLEAQELQLLGEMEMSDAIGMFVEKDDIHAISTYVTKAFKKLTKTAQSSSADADKDIDEEDVEEMLTRAKEQQAQEYSEKMKESRTKDKGKSKSKGAADNSDADSMMMDDPMGGSDFDVSEPAPPPKKKTAAKPAAKGKGKAKAAVSDDDEDSDEPPPPKKKAPAKAAPKKAAPAKKAPAKRGKKAVSESDDDDIIEVDSDSDEAPKKKPPAKKTTAAAKKTATTSTQPKLSFVPARSSRAAATKARGKMVVDDDSDD